MQVEVCQVAVPEMREGYRRVGVVIAGNPPNPVSNTCQFFVQRSLRFLIAQQHGRARLGGKRHLDDVPESPMRVRDSGRGRPSPYSFASVVLGLSPYRLPAPEDIQAMNARPASRSTSCERPEARSLTPSLSWGW